MAIYFISKTNWFDFLKSVISKYTTYGLYAEGANLFWEKVNSDNLSNLIFGKYRSVHPIKNFFFPVKEEVTNQPKQDKIVLLGAKNCDLGHLRTTDSIFAGGVLVDPYYQTKRENTIIISSDCDAFVSSCFCTLMASQPYPEKDFDINLSRLDEGFLAETGSPHGNELISMHKSLFVEPKRNHFQQRDFKRSEITQSVNLNNKNFSWTNPKETVEKKFESPVWKTDIAATCVECDACRFTCGTCYCFLLSETSKFWKKIRTWDSCQSEGYGRVAGGANPRKARWERLRNFYTCKLLYRHENFGFYACTGCGRCIDVCHGKIDIRQSLQKLETT